MRNCWGVLCSRGTKRMWVEKNLWLSDKENANARKITKEKKAVTHTWLTKVFSTRLLQPGKIRSQAISQRQSNTDFPVTPCKTEDGPSYFKRSRIHSTWNFHLDTSWPRTAALSNFGKNPRSGEEREMCSCQGNDWKLQKRVNVLLGHVNLTLFTLFFHFQDRHHFSYAWVHHLGQLITSLFGSSFPQWKQTAIPILTWNNYTKTMKHRSRLRFRPTTRRMLWNGVKFTKTEGVMGTQTNFATLGRCGK